MLHNQSEAKLLLTTHDERKLGEGLVEKLAVKDYVSDANFATYIKVGEEITFN